MTNRETVLKHKDDVYVAINELITPYTVNRNIRKLLQNDRELQKLYDRILGGISIREFQKNSITPYQYGEIVWFRDRDAKLWLLRNVIQSNGNDPQTPIDEKESYVNGNPDFQKYGWEDANESVDIKGIVEKQISQMVSQ